MKCPVCYASQEIIDGEIIHICPYCDAILIYDGSLKRVDSFPWWIRGGIKIPANEGIIVTEKRSLHFQYKEKWFLDNKYEMILNEESRGEMNEKVLEIYGKLPIFVLPGLKIGLEYHDNLTIRHHKGSAIFKRIEK